MFTDNALFAKLGLKVPQTFAQLLAVCRAAKAPRHVRGDSRRGECRLRDGAARPRRSALVYAKDKHAGSLELKAGTVTFDGSPGWHKALQEFVEMNSAGCFQPGVTGTTQGAAEAEFAQGQGLMLPYNSGVKGAIDALDPQFPGFSVRPRPRPGLRPIR